MKKYFEYIIAGIGCCVAGIGGLLLLATLNTCNAQYFYNCDGGGLATLIDTNGDLRDYMTVGSVIWVPDGVYTINVLDNPVSEEFVFSIDGNDYGPGEYVFLLEGGNATYLNPTGPLDTDLDGNIGVPDLLDLLTVFNTQY